MNIENTTEKRNHARRVVFVKPHGLVQEQLLHTLMLNEFEATYVQSKEAAEKVIQNLQAPILYINIDETGIPDHKSWIETLSKNYADKEFSLGVISDSPDRDLAEYYLMDLDLPNGYTFLKAGAAEVTKYIVNTLHDQKARGDRRHVRVRLPKGKDTVNFHIGDKKISGVLFDMSVVSFACAVDEHISHGTKPSKVEFNLRGKSLVIEGGEMVGNRNLPNNKGVHIYHFEGLQKPEIESLQEFIHATMHEEVNS